MTEVQVANVGQVGYISVNWVVWFSHRIVVSKLGQKDQIILAPVWDNHVGLNRTGHMSFLTTDQNRKGHPNYPGLARLD